MRVGSPPSAFIAARIAARSTTAGTPVKSCSSTRAGMNAISLAGVGLRIPAGERADVRFLDLLAVLVAQQVLEQDAQRERQPPRREPGLLQRGELVDLELAFPDVEGGLAAEAVRHGRILSVGRRRCREGMSSFCEAASSAKVRPLPSLGGGGRLVARLLRRFQVVQAVELLLRGVPRRAAGGGIAGEMFLDALECFLIDGRRLVLRARDVGQAGLLRVRVGQAVAALFLAGERGLVVVGVGRRAGGDATPAMTMDSEAKNR